MQINSIPNTTTTGSKRYKAVRSKILAQLAELKRKELERKRSESKAVNPTVQMSIRMNQEEYLQFRALCKAERRTNGDMVQRLMEFHLSNAGSDTRTLT
ncbi:hypothetical protein GCM10011363_22560 [Marivita lacus]|uniref:Ribbon-helix-helix protein, CopG family n=1 Tax=Marivita lacus TaxID=1323742 RepID=A0ABQ1KMZ7_9RHOB|nr:hypothetical protein GCM10011363_22560 [Marivita lacus]